MFSPLKRPGSHPSEQKRSRLSQLAILSLATSAVLCTSGCDDAVEADKKLNNAISQANVISDSTDAQFEGAASAIQAATLGNVSPASKAQAKAKLASMELQQADDLLRDAARKDIAAAKIAMEILQAASQVQATNLQIDAYKKLNPSEIKAKIEAMIAAARGGATQVAWIGEGPSAIPTEAAAQQTVSKLEGDITQRKAQIAQLTEQRTAAIAEAEKFAKASEDAKGQESVDAFKKSSEARKQANIIASQIELQNAQLIPVQKDLEVSQGQQAAAGEAIKQLQDQLKMLDEAWESMQKQIAAQTQLAKEIVATDGSLAVPAIEGSDTSVSDVAGKSLSAKAEALKKLSEEADKIREEAIAKLDSASSKTKEAFVEVQEFETNLGKFENQPQFAGAKAAFDLGHSVISMRQYKLSEGLVTQQIGRTNLAKATALATRIAINQAVTPVLQGASQSIPASLGNPADLAKQFKEAIDRATESLGLADETLGGVTGAGKSQSDRSAVSAALVQSALVQYDLYRCALLENKKEDADKHLAAAQQKIVEAAESNAYFPGLPEQLAEKIPVKAPPTTEPAAETAATQPAEGAAPTTAPTEGTAPADGATPATPPSETPATPADGATPPPAPPATPPSDTPPPVENPPAADTPAGGKG